MRVLALEPYYGGSHKAFLDGWSNRSRHNWTALTLPAYKWKWRMRHSAVTFAKEVTKRSESGETWDVIFCSDMLNLAEFMGLLRSDVRDLPSVVYFHENQLTYPVRFESERDFQFAMTNLTTALAATKLWFNSSFHRDSFLEALGAFFGRMPDFQPTEEAKQLREKSFVYPPGVKEIKVKTNKGNGPLHILWAARWEYDKNAEDFFQACKILKSNYTAFKLSVIGEQFRNRPQVFNWAKEYFAAEIVNWGYQQSRVEYEKRLAEADVMVSTAGHEFFGISVIEAVSAGVLPILPRRLSYPEILGLGENEAMDCFFYDGDVKSLADKLNLLASKKKNGNLWEKIPKLSKSVERFEWSTISGILDTALEN